MKLTHIALVTIIPSLAAADAPPKPVETLTMLAGTWKGNGTATMGKDKAKVDFTWTCKTTPSKFGTTCSLALKGIPGLAVYDEQDLFGYEPNSDTYHWFAVTNGGETHDHVAKRVDGGKLQFTYTGTQEGKPYKEVIDVEIAKDAVSVHSESFVAGQLAMVLEGKGHK